MRAACAIVQAQRACDQTNLSSLDPATGLTLSRQVKTPPRSPSACPEPEGEHVALEVLAVEVGQGAAVAQLHVVLRWWGRLPRPGART
jgi:hypothetical protein